MTRVASFAAAITLGFVLLAWCVSLVSGYDVTSDVDVLRASALPSAEHWLGTDHLGRDVAWRMLKSSEAFMGPALLACLVALGFGLPAGAIAGWSGGPIAGGVRYLFTVLESLPRFVLVLLACAIFGSEVAVIGLVAGVAYAPTLGEAIHARIESFRRAEFVLAAEAHGVHPVRVLVHHLLWVNCRRLVARHALMLFAYLLLLETTLSYIGGLDGAGSFGVAQPDPSWGNMIAFEWREPDANPWASWAPGLAIWGVILSAAWIGDALVEASDG
ncbi:MAG: ABC transporter permease [Proteobacteria bacterium]|nr:ABC transporter permease [Pseudomonadota bacterium]MCP4921593.1 ABC transporter permease [Pseudomonadota bacterium]